MTITYDALSAYTYDVFKIMGHTDAHARQATDVLLSADLRGIDSHGVARLSGYYRLWKQNRVNATPNMKITHERPGTATLDADRALGLISAPFAMKLAIEKAKKVGSGWVAVGNSNHFGIAGYHSMLASNQDCIGMSMTNASPLVAPTFSTERLLGTNPIAIAIPALHEPTFVADFATTTAANGKLEILNREGKPAPLGWVQDDQGQESKDPSILKNGGALLPLGGDRLHGSHKGFCLGAMVDILSGVLSGSGFGPWAPPFVDFLPQPKNAPGTGLGHFIGAYSIDGFSSKKEFKSKMDIWIQRFRDAAVVKDQSHVIIPGDPERASEVNRRKNGIPLNTKVVKDLKTLGKEIGLTFG